jgi:hypothetical protein
MPNSPVSGRKVREAAGKALASTNLQAEMLKGLIDKHNSLVKDTAETFTAHSRALNLAADLFLGRSFLGKLKFILTGK